MAECVSRWRRCQYMSQRLAHVLTIDTGNWLATLQSTVVFRSVTSPATNDRAPSLTGAGMSLEPIDYLLEPNMFHASPFSTQWASAANLTYDLSVQTYAIDYTKYYPVISHLRYFHWNVSYPIISQQIGCYTQISTLWSTEHFLISSQHGLNWAGSLRISAAAPLIWDPPPLIWDPLPQMEIQHLNVQTLRCWISIWRH